MSYFSLRANFAIKICLNKKKKKKKKKNPVESPEFFRFTRQLLKLSSKCEDHIFI